MAMVPIQSNHLTQPGETRAVTDATKPSSSVGCAFNRLFSNLRSHAQRSAPEASPVSVLWLEAPQEQPGQQQDHRDDQGWHDGAWRDDSWPSQHYHAGSWHHGDWQYASWQNWSWGNEPYRYGTNGGRERSGYSGGSNRVYYKGFYHAKGKGKAAVARYVEAYGEPPAVGTGRCYHEQACRSYFA